MLIGIEKQGHIHVVIKICETTTDKRIIGITLHHPYQQQLSSLLVLSNQ